MIGAMGWTRETVFICNVLKCRPPNNRDPQPDEVEQCEPFLARQIEAIRPRMIVTLGKPAAHLVLKSRAPISALRGNFHRYQGIPVMPTFHPAYLLRSPERKSDTWSDLRKVIEELRRLGVETPLPPRD
jgi:DNA polymerase